MSYVSCINFIVVLILFNQIITVYSTPCNFHNTVDITNGTRFKNDSIKYDNLIYSSNLHFEHLDADNKSTIRGCICELKSCVRKCCPHGKAYYNNTCLETDKSYFNMSKLTVYDHSEKLENFDFESHFVILTEFNCKLTYPLLTFNEGDDKNSGDHFFLQQGGKLSYFHDDIEETIPLEEYCLETFMLKPRFVKDETEWEPQIIARICYNEEDEILESSYFKLYSHGMIISIPFLIITFIVYAVIPELRNLHGKCLMGYVAGLTVGYTFLSSAQIKPELFNDNTTLCLCIAFIIYIAFMSSFFWLNVMCFYIWFQFSHMRAPRGSRRSTEKRRFILFGLYAWGSSLVLASICAIMQFAPDLPNHLILPRIGEMTCWFHHRIAQFLYFYLPIMCLVICNIILFLITAYKIQSIKRETAMLDHGDSQRHQYERNKQKFNLYFKLFLVMGINWVAEWVSFIVGDKYTWLFLLTDLCNTMHGIFVFILFVCQKKVKNLVMKRYRHLRYGSTVSRTRDSSRYHTGNTMSSMDQSSKGSFISSMNENGMKLTDMKKSNI